MEWVWEALISVNFQDSPLISGEGRGKAAVMKDDLGAEI